MLLDVPCLFLLISLGWLAGWNLVEKVSKKEESISSICPQEYKEQLNPKRAELETFDARAYLV